jgi:transcriptional regulator with XRE-family HTH domain
MIPSSISDLPGHAPEPSSAEQTTQTRRGWVPALPRIDITTDDTLSDVSKDQREPHRHLSDEICEVLRRVRLSKGWSYRAAARATGVNAGYLCHLEHGRRVPNAVVVEALIQAYVITGSDASMLREAGLVGVGRDWHRREVPILPPTLPKPLWERGRSVGYRHNSVCLGGL